MAPNKIYVVAFVLSLSARAIAGGPESREARREYDAGVAAFDAGQFREAAARFGAADALSPNDVALEQALSSAIKADDAAQVMRLAERASRRKTKALEGLAKVAVSRFSSRVGELVFDCPQAARCRATVDGVTYPSPERLWVETGRRSVVFVVDAEESRRDVEVPPGGLVRIGAPTASPAPNEVRRSDTPPPPRTGTTPSRGPSNAFFWMSAGATALVGGATVLSGLDALKKNDAYNSTPTQERLDDGKSAQLRTNILVGVTAGLAATSVVLAFVVRWKSTPNDASAYLTPEGVGVRGTF